MEKTGYQKALKILCIIDIVLAGLGLASAILLSGVGILGLSSGAAQPNAVQGTVNGVEVTGASAAGMLSVLGIVTAVACILSIVMAALGIRGANNPSKIKPFYVLVVICIIVNIVNVWLAFTNGGNPSVSLGLIYDFVLLFLATRIKQQA